MYRSERQSKLDSTAVSRPSAHLAETPPSGKGGHGKRIHRAKISPIPSTVAECGILDDSGNQGSCGNPSSLTRKQLHLQRLRDSKEVTLPPKRQHFAIQTPPSSSSLVSESIIQKAPRLSLDSSLHRRRNENGNQNVSLLTDNGIRFKTGIPLPRASISPRIERIIAGTPRRAVPRSAPSKISRFSSATSAPKEKKNTANTVITTGSSSVAERKRLEYHVSKSKTEDSELGAIISDVCQGTKDETDHDSKEPFDRNHGLGQSSAYEKVTMSKDAQSENSDHSLQSQPNNFEVSTSEEKRLPEQSSSLLRLRAKRDAKLTHFQNSMTIAKARNINNKLTIHSEETAPLPTNTDLNSLVEALSVLKQKNQTRTANLAKKISQQTIQTA